MRICVFLPDHCQDSFSVTFSRFIYENAAALGYNVAFARSTDQLQPNDLVLFRFGSDYENWTYANTEKTSSVLSSLIYSIESKGCVCFPNSYMMQFYENKVKLFELFQKANVNIPDTFIVNHLNSESIDSITKYPVIIKWAFSCSSNGIEQASTKEELLHKLQTFFAERNEPVIVQRKIMATKEARITYFGDSVFHGYYRIRPSVNLPSAATRFGSTVDFSIDRQKYTSFIQDFIQKTGFKQGGIDIIWENDDETSQPFVLEVSPIFDINPPTPEGWTLPYSDFKKSPMFQHLRYSTLDDASKIFIEFAVKEYIKPRLYIDIDNTITDSASRIRAFPSEYTLAKHYLQDTVYDSFLRFFESVRAKSNVSFITARTQYENAFPNTQAWLLQWNLYYSNLIIVHSLQDKLPLLKAVDSNIQYVWFDDCTHSHHLETPILDQEILLQVKELKLPLVLIKDQSTWNTIKSFI